MKYALIILVIVCCFGCKPKKEMVATEKEIIPISDAPATNSTTKEAPKTLLHQFILFNRNRPIIIEKWNIATTSKKNIRETVDSTNRVTKLEFLRDGKRSAYGIFPMVTINYEYTDNTIIEIALDEDGVPINADTDGLHYKSIYHLDTENYITKIERFADYTIRDSIWAMTNTPPPTREELEAFVKEYEVLLPIDKPLEIAFYKYSYRKLDGMYPVSRNYVIRPVPDTLFLNTSMEEYINKGVKKLKGID